MDAFIYSTRRTRGGPRRDYLALNNGMETPVFIPSASDTSGESACDESSSTIEVTTTLGPLQSGSSPPLSTQSGESSDRGRQETVSSSVADVSVSPPDSLVLTTRKEKAHTSWTTAHFWITDLDATWSKNGRALRHDRLLVCKRCSWASRDSARHGTTSNLVTHLRTRHHVGPGSAASPGPTSGGLDRFLQPTRARVTVEQALVRWSVQSRQPFTAVEHPAFRAIFDAAGVDLPIRCADTLRDRVKTAFHTRRGDLKLDLAQQCQSIAISVDVWTSDHQVAIFAAVGRWLTEDFDQREALLEFAELPGVHSGENMAALLWSTLQELDIGSKLISITGDNAGNNGTLCDALRTTMLQHYDEEDEDFPLQPLMRFRGRDSFIRCLAHIIHLVCKELLGQLSGGTMPATSPMPCDPPNDAWAGTGGDRITDAGPVGKIRSLALWIARSPQRRQEWKQVSPDKTLGYDVETRWNSTYTMITDAIRLRKEITHFTRSRSDIAGWQLSDTDWVVLDQVRMILRPFWEHTQTVSRDGSGVVDSLAIYWSLGDLLHRVRHGQGEWSGVDAGVRDMVSTAQDKMSKFTSLMQNNMIYYVAAVLDPRVKTCLIDTQLAPADAQEINFRLRRFLKRKYPREADLPLPTERPDGMSETLWQTLMKVQSHTRAAVSDVDRYLDSPPASWSHQSMADGDRDWVLKWWKANAFEYPMMARAARDYLAIPSSEVAVERTFSGARDVLGLRRHSMRAETMRWLVLLKDQYDLC